MLHQGHRKFHYELVRSIACYDTVRIKHLFTSFVGVKRIESQRHIFPRRKMVQRFDIFYAIENRQWFFRVSWNSCDKLGSGDGIAGVDNLVAHLDLSKQPTFSLQFCIIYDHIFQGIDTNAFGTNLPDVRRLYVRHIPPFFEIIGVQVFLDTLPLLQENAISRVHVVVHACNQRLHRGGMSVHKSFRWTQY